LIHLKILKKTIHISGAGCCLVDQIYPDINFSDPRVAPFMSRRKGDGGLHPGRLVFSEQFEKFSRRNLSASVAEISRDRPEPVFNVGGPSIVALIHAAQLLQESRARINFYGARGDDKAGEYLQSKLELTPVNLEHFVTTKGSTPSTIVLSDPAYNDGHGERIFINDIGAAWNFGPENLPERFYESDLVVFGGTALVPHLHDGLKNLLEKSKSRGCITVVNTVYDFRSEIENPGEQWTFGESSESYQFIDLLIMDREEAQHLSGKENLEEAGSYFMDQGVSGYIITNGTEITISNSDGKLFRAPELKGYPVSKALVNDLKGFTGGDTTGCGDNFVGGVLASMAWQLSENKELLDLEECIAWGTVSGGYGCFHVGGTQIEAEPGEKLKEINLYYDLYKQQIHGS
jgi:sugar/nucleoside kinase (ribokinase family)